jgi:hypothetical protein
MLAARQSTTDLDEPDGVPLLLFETQMQQQQQ